MKNEPIHGAHFMRWKEIRIKKKKLKKRENKWAVPLTRFGFFTFFVLFFYLGTSMKYVFRSMDEPEPVLSLTPNEFFNWNLLGSGSFSLHPLFKIKICSFLHFDHKREWNVLMRNTYTYCRQPTRKKPITFIIWICFSFFVFWFSLNTLSHDHIIWMQLFLPFVLCCALSLYACVNSIFVLSKMTKSNFAQKAYFPYLIS